MKICNTVTERREKFFLHSVNYTAHPRDLIQNAYRSTGYVSMPRRSFIGFTEHLVYIKDGERYNMAKAFLTPVKERPNLFFTRNTEVEGIVVTEPIDKRASGVNVSIDGVKFFIRAKKEVIMTAGAINNAKLLLVSGIGPRNYLTDRGIPTIADLPAVGKNLQLHLSVPIFIAIDPCEGCPKDYYREMDLINDVFAYVMHRTGNLSHININEFANYILTHKSGASMPNIGIHHSYFKIGDRSLLAFLDGMNYHPKIAKSLIDYNQERAIMCFYISLLTPESRGEVLLNDTHFLGSPKIVANFMTDEEDSDFSILFSGFNYITNLTEVESMKKHKAEFLNLDIPNCRNFKFCSSPYVKCYISNMAFPKSDSVGTLRMGSECEPISVVREDLEVKSVRCLRVADSSVLGYIPVGNTVATDAMIGYNLGEILKEKWLKDYESPYHIHKYSDEDEEAPKNH
ncbi:hypothetical protein NQ314_015745 [Rhamnusium bicolor]|uniref:Uncharacterized protein n=1 Tax=Rhamnusium bicolor TaxID=1586634 RepID=A0AAV8WY13_9CUCU|nr:hypothetical protein NQ314_015745 [Rhamnusium bicolor]